MSASSLTRNQTAVRKAVASAWRRALDRESLIADRPFDEAGGDSLCLLKLIFLLEQNVGASLPMDACHLAMRPSDLLRITQDALRPCEADPVSPDTIFLLPGMGGDSPLLGAFRAACAPHLPFITLDLPDWQDLVRSDIALGQLAGRAATEILHRYSDGPVRLAGFSLGGEVAYATALALRKAGREVAFLGILDTDADFASDHGSTATSADGFRRLAWDVQHLWRAATSRRLAERAALIAVRELTRPSRARFLRLIARHRRVSWPREFAYFLDRYLREALQKRLTDAWRRSQTSPPSLDVPTVLFRSEAHAPDAVHDLGWHRRCPSLHVVLRPGSHEGMLRPPNLAGLVRCFVDAVTAGAPPPVDDIECREPPAHKIVPA